MPGDVAYTYAPTAPPRLELLRMSTRTTSPQAAVTHFAGRAGDHNDRAMAASPRLTAALSAHYGVTPTVIGTPRSAQPTSWDIELDAVSGELRQMRHHYERILAHGQVPVTALSRCPVALATLPVVAQRHPDAVVVWFDAHPDLNTPATTSTNHLGGLTLAGPLGLWNSGFGAGLKTENTILAGTRAIDSPEQVLIDSTDLTLVEPGPHIAERLRQVVDGRKVYIHIDCDVLDPGILPTGNQVPEGLSLTDLHEAATVLAESAVVGIEIAELETDTGSEDLNPLLNALSPVLDAILDP